MTQVIALSLQTQPTPNGQCPSSNNTVCDTNNVNDWAYEVIDCENPGGRGTCCVQNSAFATCPDIGNQVGSPTYYQDYQATLPSGASCWQLYPSDVYSVCTYNIQPGQVTSQQVTNFIDNMNTALSASNPPIGFNWQGQFDSLMSVYCGQIEPDDTICPPQVEILGATGTRPGCSLFLTDQNCINWKNSTDPTTQSAVNSTMQNFCTGKDPTQWSECLCINATADPLFQQLIGTVNKGNNAGNLFGPTTCWWPGCSSTASTTILIPSQNPPITCPDKCIINAETATQDVINCFNSNTNNNGGGGGSSFFTSTAFIVGVVIVILIIAIIFALLAVFR